jgi:hypothetical protein
MYRSISELCTGVSQSIPATPPFRSFETTDLPPRPALSMVFAPNEWEKLFRDEGVAALNRNTKREVPSVLPCEGTAV